MPHLYRFGRCLLTQDAATRSEANDSRAFRAAAAGALGCNTQGPYIDVLQRAALDDVSVAGAGRLELPPLSGLEDCHLDSLRVRNCQASNACNVSLVVLRSYTSLFGCRAVYRHQLHQGATLLALMTPCAARDMNDAIHVATVVRATSW